MAERFAMNHHLNRLEPDAALFAEEPARIQALMQAAFSAAEAEGSSHITALFKAGEAKKEYLSAEEARRKLFSSLECPGYRGGGV